LEKESKIFIAGHKGMVGSAIVRALILSGYNNLVMRTSKEIDLSDKNATEEFFNVEKPEYVFLAAAKVGGIQANLNFPATFLYENLLIETNVIHAAYKFKSKKLLFLGSSCIYPKNALQPISEQALLSGYLEPSNAAYAISKIAGIELCKSYRTQYGCNFISCMPANLYGPNDNYDTENSHVMAALIRKTLLAVKNNSHSISVWGTGKPQREFLHADDLAEACLFLMKNYNASEIINVGTGMDISIAELIKLIAEIVHYKGQIKYDTRMPDGTFQKLLDCRKIHALGWKHKIELKEGITSVVKELQVRPMLFD
jgi:GDP-L-fucose synthase